jgi:hypothetical protein
MFISKFTTPAPEVTTVLNYSLNPTESRMLAEDLVLAVGACTILAFARILWQMARQERLLREMMRVQQELLKTLLLERVASPDNCRVEPVEDRSRLGTGLVGTVRLSRQESRSTKPPSSRPSSSESIHSRQSLHFGGLGSCVDSKVINEFVAQTRAAAFCDTVPRCSSLPAEVARAGARQIVASESSSKTASFSRCASYPAAGSREVADVAADFLQGQSSQSESVRPRRPHSSHLAKTSSGISSARLPPPHPSGAAASLSQHSTLVISRWEAAAVSMLCGGLPGRNSHCAWLQLCLTAAADGVYCSCSETDRALLHTP